jgi:hypothetical protein
MAGPTITKTKATANRLVYLVVGDGEDAAGLIDSVTLLADAAPGPLRNALKASYATQAAMRAVFGGGNVPLECNHRTGTGSFAADVDVDAITATRPEVNIVSPVDGTDAMYLVIEHKHTFIR